MAEDEPAWECPWLRGVGDDALALEDAPAGVASATGAAAAGPSAAATRAAAPRGAAASSMAQHKVVQALRGK